MKHLNLITKNELLALVSFREGETKVGQALALYNGSLPLKNTPQPFALLGIPEDIGVRANYGRQGTSGAWTAFLQNACNMQYHKQSIWDQVMLMGTVDCTDEMEAASKIDDVTALGALVEQIDKKVSEVIQNLVSAGKIPIIIGGGHNNSFGNSKGTSQALQQAINCVNFDPHSDYRPLEHRHSGNGFRYAKEEGFLDKYHIFGLQKLYNSEGIMNAIKQSQGRVSYTSFNDIKERNKTSLTSFFNSVEEEVCQGAFGLELDMDAIEMMGSSAMSAVGFSITDARAYISHFSALKNCRYIHLCEGAPALELFPNQVGRTLAYLVSDILKKSK